DPLEELLLALEPPQLDFGVVMGVEDETHRLAGGVSLDAPHHACLAAVETVGEAQQCSQSYGAVAALAVEQAERFEEGLGRAAQVEAGERRQDGHFVGGEPAELAVLH